jgi:phage terminase small subunit
MVSTARRERFARYKAYGLSGLRAAKLAGYSEKSAYTLSSQLSRIPEVSRHPGTSKPDER